MALNIKKVDNRKALTENKNKHVKWYLIIIIFVTIFAYASSLNNNFILNWDDDRYVKDNPLIKDLNLLSVKKIFSEFYISNYQPITLISLAVDYKMFNGEPKGFHFVNLLFHLLNIILVYLLINKISGDWRIGIFVSAFFALHPMHVESVAWISERKDVLYSFFFLLSLLFYLKYLNSENKFNYYRIKYLVLVFILFVFSVLSKSAGIVLPIVILLMDIYNPKINRSRICSLKLIFEKIPFFAVSIIFGIIAINAQKQGGAIQDTSAAFGTVEKVPLICSNLFYYFSQAFIPYNLSAFHFYPDKIEIWHWMSVLFFIIISVLIIKFRIFKKQIMFGILFFVICLSMVLQIIPVGGAIVAERYTYLPYIGLFFSIAIVFVQILDSKNAKVSKIKMPLILITIFSFIAYSVITYNRVKVWKNADTLFSDLIEKEPERDLGYYLRGIGRAVVNNKKEALEDFNNSISRNPNYAEAYYARGLVRSELNDPENSFKDYSKAIELKPEYVDAYNNRGALFLKYKMYDKAINDFKEAIKINPEFGKGYYNIAACYINTGNKDEGCKNLKIAAELGYEQSQEMILKFCR